MNKLRIGAAAAVAMSLVAAAAPVINATAAQTSTAAPSGLSKYTTQKLAWTKCTFDTQGVPTLCALMTVPRDWASPDSGKDLQVYVSKVVATGTKDAYQGVVLTNPGGPGGQGSSLAPAIAQLQPSLNKAYDVLGMDPRGTGQEGAAGDAGDGISCSVPAGRLPAGPLDARDRSSESIKVHQQVPRALAEACQSLAEAPYITTWQTAHDMELIRRLAGAKKLNYIGYSYGTWLGAKYASLFPAGTGRIVLDSSVDWQGRLQADFEDFPRMGQRQTDDVFLPWLTRVQPAVFGNSVASARKVIEQNRAKAGLVGFDPDMYDSLFAGNGNEFTWALALLVLVVLNDADGNTKPEIAALPAAVRSQLGTVSVKRFGVPAAKVTKKLLVTKRLGLTADDTDYEKVPLTRFSVACGDQTTKSVQWYKTLSDHQGPRLPYFGWQYGLSEVCGPWTDEPLQKLPQLPVSVRANILLVQGEFDPQTSYEQAMAAARKAPGISVLRVDDSPFHGQYATQGNPCVDGVVNTYLLHGSTTPNSICPSVPISGDSKVFPVRGPVDQYLTANKANRSPAHQAAKSADDALRREIAERISEVNDLFR
jgi:pimeloyl-ACP methyl ester carboxylesterase